MSHSFDIQIYQNEKYVSIAYNTNVFKRSRNFVTFDSVKFSFFDENKFFDDLNTNNQIIRHKIVNHNKKNFVNVKNFFFQWQFWNSKKNVRRSKKSAKKNICRRCFKYLFNKKNVYRRFKCCLTKKTFVIVVSNVIQQKKNVCRHCFKKISIEKNIHRFKSKNRNFRRFFNFQKTFFVEKNRAKKTFLSNFQFTIEKSDQQHKQKNEQIDVSLKIANNFDDLKRHVEKIQQISK